MKETTLVARLKKPWQGFSIEIYIDKLADTGRNIVRQSYEEAKSLDHKQLNPEHALIAFSNFQQEFFDSLLHGLGLDRQTVLQALSTAPGHHNSDVVRITKSFSRMLSNSLKSAREQGRRRIEALDILVAIFEDKESLTVKVFKKLGIDRDTVIGEMINLAQQRKYSKNCLVCRLSVS